MANPITWRNVASSPAHVTGMMQGASNNANMAFRNFNQVLEREQQLQMQQRDAQVELAATAARDILDSYQTADDLAAAQESGEVAQRLDQLGPYLDRETFRGAADERLGNLRAQEFAELQRLDQESRLANRDFMGSLVQDVITNPDNLFTAIENMDNAPAPVTNREEAIHSLLSAASVGQDRQDIDRRRRQVRAIEDAHREANEASQDYVTALSEGNQGILSAAMESGVPFVGGNPDYSSASPEAMRRFQQTIESQELLTRAESPTRFINSTIQRITANPDLPPAEREALRERLTHQFIMETELSPIDQAAWGMEEQRIGETYNINTNPFAEERKDVAVEALEVLASMPGFDDLSESRRSELVQATASALSGTMKIGGNEVSVTPGVLKLAMQSQGWSWKNRNRTDILKNLSKVSNSLDLAGRYKEYQDYQTALKGERERFIASRGVKPPYETTAAEAVTAIREAAQAERARERELQRIRREERETPTQPDPIDEIVEEAEQQALSERIGASLGRNRLGARPVMNAVVTGAYNRERARVAEAEAMREGLDSIQESISNFTRSLRENW